MRYTAVALDFDGTIAHDSEVPAHVCAITRSARAEVPEARDERARERSTGLEAAAEDTLAAASGE